MRKYIPLTFILSWTYTALFSQSRTQNFQLALSDLKIQNSIYNSIKCLDSRYDTNSVGIVQRGIFNEKVKLIPKPSLNEQLINILNALIDSSAKQGELLFHFRQFNFAEITGTFSERGYCYIRAELFSNSLGRYKILGRMDSIILVKATDVTNPLLRKGSQSISRFIADNLLKIPSDSNSYSYNDIINIDSFEKSNLLVYNTITYTNGLYKTFKTFLDQTPDNQITAKVKGQNISDIKALKENGKVETLNSKDIYAIVYEGIPYISTEFGYYQLYKTNRDFFFIGKAKATANSGDVVTASLFFGLIGGLIASNANATFEMRIDHHYGGFIRLREVKK